VAHDRSNRIAKRQFSCRVHRSRTDSNGKHRVVAAARTGDRRELFGTL